MKTIRLNTLCVFALAFFAFVSVAATRAQQLSPKLQNAVGNWQTYDGGKPAGKVETYLLNGQLYGRVIEVRPGRTPQDVCDKCSGEYKNHLILGMVIMRNFHIDGEDWVGGNVVDPENGKDYKGKIWSEGNDKLHMRGYIGISLLGRTEVWTRIP